MTIYLTCISIFQCSNARFWFSNVKKLQSLFNIFKKIVSLWKINIPIHKYIANIITHFLSTTCQIEDWSTGIRKKKIELLKNMTKKPLTVWQARQACPKTLEIAFSQNNLNFLNITFTNESFRHGPQICSWTILKTY